MWISKKKLDQIKRAENSDGFIKGMDSQAESEQWERIEKLEKQVKKLKKWVKNGY